MNKAYIGLKTINCKTLKLFKQVQQKLSVIYCRILEFVTLKNSNRNDSRTNESI